MHLNIYSLQQVLFEGNAMSVNCVTESGDVTILDRHEPLIATLAPCTIKITDAQHKDHYVPIGRGFLEVTAANTATILADETTA